MSQLSNLAPAAQGILQIAALLIGTLVAWFALGAVRWDVFVKAPESAPARLLRLLFAILIGSGIAGFIVAYGGAVSSIHG